MTTVTLPDGKELSFDATVTGLEVAQTIGPGLAKKALAITCNGKLQDLSATVTDGAQIAIMTASNDDVASLDLLRHSCAHVMAEAICELFPGTQLAYGPSIEEGYFYDMKTPRSLNEEDFAAIEERMKAIVKENRPFKRIDVDHAAGLERTKGDAYKTDNAERAIARGSETLSFYVTGDEGTHFEDLCAGPHVPSTKFVEHFKIMSVAGAYLHGDQNSDQLTRVYGTCFADKKGLKKHLQRLEEAKKRDHRRIGKEMDLFHINEDNPGQIFWHHNGWTIYRGIVDYVRERISKAGYIEVNTPSLQPQGLWERSGHWAKYRENMFITFEQDRGAGGCNHGHEEVADDPAEAANRCFSLKPMNCPGHIEIFKHSLRSYRDLPMRMAEFGSCVRYEPSGALHGIMRVRGFVQDDAHIFCTEAQIGDEVADFCALLKDMYAAFGFDVDAVKVKFSTRPDVRVGSDEEWDQAEAALEAACKQAELSYEISPGEGAFYGPKLEFTLIDCLGREWQCGTIQVDYQLAGPDRLNATYVAEDGSRQHPIILHRAICGSIERFVGILIEQYAGKFPLWLSPEQIRVLPITDDQQEACYALVKQLTDAGIRATCDERSEKLGAKIRQARNDRVSYFGVVGGQEVENGTISLQRQNGDKVGVMSVEDLITQLSEEIACKK